MSVPRAARSGRGTANLEMAEDQTQGHREQGARARQPDWKQSMLQPADHAH